MANLLSVFPLVHHAADEIKLEAAVSEDDSVEEALSVDFEVLSDQKQSTSTAGLDMRSGMLIFVCRSLCR